MATFLRRICIIFVSILWFSDYGFLGRVASFGINYGQVGNNLPDPQNVIALLASLKLTKARIYDTNPRILSAFANSNIELIVTIENQMLAQLMDPQQALQWVTTRIKPYFPATNITGIAVGNEIFTDPDTSLMSSLIPAMVSIQRALAQLGLSPYIHMSTPSSLAILQNSYPPSAGTFKPELSGIVSQLLRFLETTRAPFWINAYPYFAYKDNPLKISLDYALFNSNSGMIDPYTNLHYDNMLYAMVDAVSFAMARMGYGDIEVRVSETGWPSKGDQNEYGATVQNAALYNKNLLRRQMGNEGTPLRPNTRLEVYLFALFNEDMKPGPTSERNYGLFQPDETMAYNVGLSGMSNTSPAATTTTTTTTTATATATATSSPSSSSATVSLTSSASKGGNKEYESLVNWMFVYLLTFQVFMTTTLS